MMFSLKTSLLVFVLFMAVHKALADCPANEEMKMTGGCEDCEAHVAQHNGKPAPCGTRPETRCACKEGYARSTRGDCILETQCPGWIAIPLL